MDILSYLLGKKSSGGGGGGELDWSELGFNSTPQSLVDIYNDAYNYAINVKTNFGNVTNINSKYKADTNLIIFPEINLENVTKAGSCFENCTLLLQVAHLNFTNKLTTLNKTFSGCTELRYVDFTDCNTSNVTDMANMFSNCQKLRELDLSSFESTSLTQTSTMFNICINLTKIDMRKFDFTTITTYTNMFGTNATYGVPDNCLIIVKDDTQKTWITTNFSRLTNVKTVAEYEA